MAAEQNLIKSTDLSNAREIDFVTSFSGSIKKLLELLGIMRLIPKEEGTMLKRHTVTGTLNSEQVGEGEVIPLSQYTVADTPVGEITLKKWRKATSAEAIINKGYNQAVIETNDKMSKDVQKDIRSDIIKSLEISGQPTIEGTGIQAALAETWGKLQVAFEDESVDSVYFINPLDLTPYLATTPITVQTEFGLSYIKNFLNLGTVIITSNVPKGTLYGTAKENMVGYYVNVAGGDVADVFNLTTDDTGLIGINEYPNNERATCENLVMSGIKIFADVNAGVIKGTINPLE